MEKRSINEQIKALEQQGALAVPKDKNSREIESSDVFLHELSKIIEGRLNKLAQLRTPGSIATSQTHIFSANRLEGLSAALRRLTESQKRARSTSIEWITATLQNKTTQVKILRLGGVAAWWQSIDGSKVGSLGITKQGKIILNTAANKKDQDAIQAAFKNQTQPLGKILNLPLDPQSPGFNAIAAP